MVSTSFCKDDSGFSEAPEDGVPLSMKLSLKDSGWRLSAPISDDGGTVAFEEEPLEYRRFLCPILSDVELERLVSMLAVS